MGAFAVRSRAIGSRFPSVPVTLESTFCAKVVTLGPKFSAAFAVLNASLNALPACLAFSPDVSGALPLTFLPFV